MGNLVFFFIGRQKNQFAIKIEDKKLVEFNRVMNDVAGQSMLNNFDYNFGK